MTMLRLASRAPTGVRNRWIEAGVEPRKRAIGQIREHDVVVRPIECRDDRKPLGMQSTDACVAHAGNSKLPVPTPDNPLPELHLVGFGSFELANELRNFVRCLVRARRGHAYPLRISNDSIPTVANS